ncbi:MAG: NAD-dependent epimerase/dehydratase family protein [Gammaproteobacteria bacterium]
MTRDEAVLVTGANGFVGRMLCDVLAASRRPLRKAVRAPLPGFSDLAVGDIGPDTDWRAAFEGVGAVVHLAARTHVLRETAPDPLAEYRRVNAAGTERLARAAAARGVRRLIFLSSVKVNGERTDARAFTEDDAPRPEDAHGVSKWEAEQALARVAAETGLEAVILRPPLVYGPGVKGNFLRLMNLVARGVPLPLGAVANRRSFVYAGNLVDAIVKALDAPQAAGRTYLVGDGEDVSTPELVRGLAWSLGVKARLAPVPPAALGVAAALAGRRAEIARLTGSLQVDSSRLRRELAWRPPFTLAQGLEQTARWYHSRSA